jgi:hypothetical protein
MGLMFYFGLGFFLTVISVPLAIVAWFKRIQPKILAKYQQRLDAAQQQTTERLASDFPHRQAANLESLLWIDTLLGRFWKSMRESDDLLTPLHKKLQAALEKGLGKLPAVIRRHLTPVTFSLEFGPALPTFSQAELLDQTLGNLQLYFGQTPVDPAYFVAKVQVKTSVVLPLARFSPRFLADFVLPLRCDAKLVNFTGCLSISHEALPRHDMYICFTDFPKLSWEVRLSLGNQRLDTLFLDVMRLRPLLNAIIALKLHGKMVYPNLIKTRIPLAPKPEDAVAAPAPGPSTGSSASA